MPTEGKKRFLSGWEVKGFAASCKLRLKPLQRVAVAHTTPHISKMNTRKAALHQNSSLEATIGTTFIHPPQVHYRPYFHAQVALASGSAPYIYPSLPSPSPSRASFCFATPHASYPNAMPITSAHDPPPAMGYGKPRYPVFTKPGP